MPDTVPTPTRTPTIAVAEAGRRLDYGFDDLLRFHGFGSPGGVAHAFKVLERALPLLGGDELCERRELTVATAFGGPGARDAFEMVARAVSGDRFRLDPGLVRPELGRASERFVFELGHRGRSVTLVLRPGHVSDAFIDLARTENRTGEQERRLTEMKWAMADRLLALPAEAVYDARA